jgi:transcriptional regulator with XRE-family HTH domain
MNDLIVKRIKDARIERGLTQKDLADYLEKTSAAISDLERGKVQVTASDLYKLSQLLNKPIEYFYGEEFGNPEIEDMLAVMRKQPKGTRSEAMEITTLLMQMQSFEDEFRNWPQDKEYPVEKALEFYNFMVPFVAAINDMATKINTMKELYDNEFKARGIDIAKNEKDA